MSILTIGKGEQPFWRERHNLSVKDEQREELARDTEEFLKKGGAIQCFDPSSRATQNIVHDAFRKAVPEDLRYGSKAKAGSGEASGALRGRDSSTAEGAKVGSDREGSGIDAGNDQDALNASA